MSAGPLTLTETIVYAFIANIFKDKFDIHAKRKINSGKKYELM